MEKSDKLDKIVEAGRTAAGINVVENPKCPAIKLAHLHQAIAVPGEIHVEKTINKQKVKAVEHMFFDSSLGCLVIKTAKNVCLVPAANICDMLKE